MTRTEILTYLGWACFAGGGAAIAVYLLHFLGRQGWRRPWNAAGLFFSAIALTQIPLFMLADGADAFIPKALAVLCLLVGVALQTVMVLRTRRRTDGPRGGPQDRRA